MWAFIRKDLVRRWRSPASTLAMLLFPLFMSGMIGLVSGGGGDDGAGFPPIKVLIEDRDGSFLTEFIKGGLGREEMSDRIATEVVGPEGRDRMAKGEASALVVFPAAFTDSLLAGRPVAIELVRNPAEGISPEVVEQGVQVLATYLDQAQRLLGAQLADLRAMTREEGVPAAARVGRLAEAVTERMAAFERYLFPPLLKVGSEKLPSATGRAGAGFSVFGYVLIMTTVMALMFVAARSVGDLYDEQKSGMLRRQMASPADLRAIIGAKFVFGAVFGVVVCAILAALGFAFRWLEPPIDPLAAVLLALGFSLAACGLLGLMFALVRTEKQAGILGWLLIMGNSAVGGSMLPVENMPAPLRAAAPWTLNYWAIDGFKELAFAGAGVAGVARDAAVLGGAGVALSLAAWALMVRRSREVRA